MTFAVLLGAVAVIAGAVASVVGFGVGSLLALGAYTLLRGA